MSSAHPKPAPNDPLSSTYPHPKVTSVASSRIVRSRYFLFAFLAIGGFLLDIWSKNAVFQWRGSPFEQGEPWWLIRNYVGIETAVNPGALFGMGSGFGWLFALVSVVALIGIIVWLFVYRAAQSSWVTFAMGCIAAGILGNLYDRLGLGYQPGWPDSWKNGVRDWILLRYQTWTWPNFNIADSLLVCGTIMLFWYTFQQPSEKHSEPQKEASM